MQHPEPTWTGQFIGGPYSPPSWWESEAQPEAFQPSMGSVLNSGAKFYGRLLPNNRMELHYTEHTLKGEENPRRCVDMPLLEMIDMLWELQIPPPNVEVKALPTRTETIEYIATFAPEEQPFLEEQSQAQLQFTAHWLYSKVPIGQMCDRVREALEEQQLLLPA
jgi:hypothetical protein